MSIPRYSMVADYDTMGQCDSVMELDMGGEWVRFDDLPKWIPCSERMPEEGQQVLISCGPFGGHRVKTVSKYEHGRFERGAFISHWQLLPEGPE